MDFPAVNNADSNTDEDSSEDFDEEDILMELSPADQQLFEALGSNDATAVQQAFRNGANVNCVRYWDEDLDEDLLESPMYSGETPLLHAVHTGHMEIVRFLIDRGANVLALDEQQQTALHHAAWGNSFDAARELLVEHNANLFALDNNNQTPFDAARELEWVVNSMSGINLSEMTGLFLEVYRNKLENEHGPFALHAIVNAAKYSFAKNVDFHPPMNMLEIILPIGHLGSEHLRVLTHSLDHQVIRNRNDRGEFPIHVACRSNAPVEVLSTLVEIDPATLQIADHTGALPIHWLCGSGAPAEYASVRYLVEQGGRDTDRSQSCGIFATAPSVWIQQFILSNRPVFDSVLPRIGGSTDEWQSISIHDCGR